MFGLVQSLVREPAPSGAVGEILASLPTDPATLVVLGFVVGSVWLVWWANRRSGRGGRGVGMGPPVGPAPPRRVGRT